jgi:excisionase family DNA binding protein
MSKILDDYLTAEQLAGQLHVTPRTVYRWCSLGEGPPRTTIGGKRFFRLTAVRAWLEKSEEPLARARA